VIEWRFARGWSERELEERLARAAGLERNFRAKWEEMLPGRGWNHYRSGAVVAREPPGPPLPTGAFQRARVAVENCAFSDPSIVTVHFDPHQPLEGRRMLVEIKVLGLHYLCSVVVGAVREEAGAERTLFAFRYDTVGDHIEQGMEWFAVDKEHATGEVRFRVESRWRPGRFPNWWSRVGFALLSPHYHRAWHHAAQWRISLLARFGSLDPPVPHDGSLVHEGPEVVYEAIRGTRDTRARRR